jgi:topoisomerase-4 subunit A
MLQLYRLSNTDITLLEEELKNLRLIISTIEQILSDEEKLKSVMKDELRKIKQEYGTERKSIIKEK